MPLPIQRNLSTLASELSFVVYFVVLAIFATWPLARILTTAAAYPEDPFITNWTLDWVWHAASTKARLFDANMFHPAPLSLAFTEHLIGIAVLLFPLRAAGVEALTAQNIALILGFAWSGYGAFVLGRLSTGSRLAAIAGGTAFMLVPFRFTQLGHLHILFSGWLPLLLAAAIFYARRPGWWRAALFGGVFLANGLTSIHWLLFGSIAVGAALIISWLFVRPARFWPPLTAATTVSLLLMLPFLLPYARASKLHGMTRSREETLAWSASVGDWLRAGELLGKYRVLFEPSVDPERWLFPGLSLLLLAIAGVASLGIRDEAAPEVIARRRAAASVAIIWIAFGFLGSLGLNAFFHRFLFEHVWAFQSLRVPARWAMIAYTGMAALAAIGVQGIVSRIPRRSRVAVGALLVAAIVWELEVTPIRYHQVSVPVPSVYRWLSTAPIEGGVLELPIALNLSDYHYLRMAPHHHRRLLNGASGFDPPHYQRLIAAYESEVIPDSFVDELEGLGCSLVVVHRESVAGRAAAVRDWLLREHQNDRLGFVGVFDGDDFVFALKKNEPRWQQMQQSERRDPSGRTPFENAAAFVLGNERIYRPITFGYLDGIRYGEVVEGPLRLSGWVVSPHGIDSITLLMGNETLRVTPQRHGRPDVLRALPWYASSPPVGFHADFPLRPAKLRERTDVQVEVVDGRGEVRRLEQMWFTWRSPAE